MMGRLVTVGVQGHRLDRSPVRGRLATNQQRHGLRAHRRPFPTCSTGYWLPDQPLKFDGDGRYVFRAENGRRRIRYVGVADPATRIEPGTLVRVSLARPWSPSNAPAGLCLQISGWYLGHGARRTAPGDCDGSVPQANQDRDSGAGPRAHPAERLGCGRGSGTSA